MNEQIESWNHCGIEPLDLTAGIFNDSMTKGFND